MGHGESHCCQYMFASDIFILPILTVASIFIFQPIWRNPMNAFLRATVLNLSFLLLTTVTFGADSTSNRKDNVVSFGVKGGAGWPAVTSPIFIAIPGEKWSIGLDYGSKTFTSDSTSSGIKSSGSFNITDTGLFARYFYGNSFNSILAINSMDSKMTVTSTDTATGGSATGSLSTSAIRFTTGVGNHWTMDWGFEIGIDWLTASTLLSSSSSASVTESSGAIDTTDTENSIKELGNLINALSAIPGIFIFSIGFSF